MKLYRVEFNGTAYVRADSKEIAEETMLDDMLGSYEEAEAEAFEVDENEL